MWSCDRSLNKYILQQINRENKVKAVVEYFVLPVGHEKHNFTIQKPGTLDKLVEECKSSDLPLKKIALFYSSPKRIYKQGSNGNQGGKMLVIYDAQTHSELPGNGVKNYGSKSVLDIICTSPTGANRNHAFLAGICYKYRNAGFQPQNWNMQGNTNQYNTYNNRGGNPNPQPNYNPVNYQ